MSDPVELPIFKYYPDPGAGGSVEASDAACAACNRGRGFISPSLLYAEKVPDDARFCPWCIADGSATALFGGTFNELAAGASDDARDEVEARTPNFMTWQDWFWPVHCRDACVYLGSPPRGELRKYPDACEGIAQELRSIGWPEQDISEMIDGLDPSGDAVGYLFRCSHCGTHVAVWDAD